MITAIEPDHLLSPLVTAHCFWRRCRHVVTDMPIAAHDAMERRMAAAECLAPPPLLASDQTWEAAIDGAYRRRAARMTGRD